MPRLIACTRCDLESSAGSQSCVEPAPVDNRSQHAPVSAAVNQWSPNVITFARRPAVAAGRSHPKRHAYRRFAAPRSIVLPKITQSHLDEIRSAARQSALTRYCCLALGREASVQRSTRGVQLPSSRQRAIPEFVDLGSKATFCCCGAQSAKIIYINCNCLRRQTRSWGKP